MGNGAWGAVTGFDPAAAQGIQGALADRAAGLGALSAKLGSARQLPGWQGQGKEAASGSFEEPLGYLAEAKSATQQAHAKVGGFAQAMSALKAKAGEVEQRAAQAGFSIGPDGSIRDSYALSGLVESLSPADRARYEQVKAELPGEVSGVLAQADQAKAQAATGLQAAGNLMAVSQLGTGAGKLDAQAAGSDLTLYVEGPKQPDGVNHDQNFQKVVDLIDSAQKSVDMTMYHLDDQNMEDAMVHAAQRGVNVRVVLDTRGETKKNQAAYDYLTANGVHVMWDSANTSADPDTANKLAYYHQKTVTVDGETSAMMSGNAVAADYKTTRDFVVMDTNKNDVAAIQDVFNHDFAGTGDKKYTPPTGDNLTWSPTTAKGNTIALIDGAKHTLNIENEEMASPDVVDHLVQAAQRGVDVHVTMTNNPSYYANLDKLTEAGVQVDLYGRSSAPYVHAKDIVADGSTAYVGSINFSENSMTNNRELGIITSDPGVVSGINTTDDSDFAGGYRYKHSTAPTTASTPSS
ncbi:MAG: phospholipase D-like domain-containing protein [Segniliparus sp.]|uniref:phospholipase D-like domain-containing protein n=1 Tax=Segniliparus sp. TaxID=2804064 RepID=UPI003F3C9D84